MNSRPPIALEIVLALAIAAPIALWSGVSQQPTTSVTWDARQYYLIASQLAAGETPAAEAPYVYRLGVPWIVAQFWPDNPPRGFFVLNVICGLLTAPLLAWWLRTGVRHFGVRLAVVALFAIAWHGPIRYVHFNNGYVDPPFMVAVLLALALLHALRTEPRRWTLAAFIALTVVGTLIRETMILLPISALLMGTKGKAAIAALRVEWQQLVPIAAAAAAITFTHVVVEADTARSFVAAALQWIRKPPTAYVLAWFTAYGPVLAVLLYDGKRVVEDLRANLDLLCFLGLCAVLAFMGGSDTERFVFWAMPVVYLLIGRVFERHLHVFKSVTIVATLAVVQAISARIFWPIPDPQVDPVPLAQTASWSERLYAFFDRVLVIDHFHWNLWSSFGSGPFRLVRLVLYVIVSAAIVVALRRRERELHTS
jgi:hypothetical protein